MPRGNELSLAVQYPDLRLKDIITRPLVRRWVKAALLGPAQLTVRFVDAEEGRALNRDFRSKDYATNVLTFAYADAPEGDGAVEAATMHDEEPVQADIVLCTDVLQDEANAQGKPLLSHAAHLIVHGVLHAQGYDHETDAEAEEMEALETGILARLGIPDPYGDR